MNQYSRILKERLRPTEYRRIPPPLRMRPEEDLFVPLIWNLFVEGINGRKYTMEQIAAACRQYDPRDPEIGDLLHPGDRVLIYDVMGPLYDPYMTHRGPYRVKKICGPYTQYEQESATPPRWTIEFHGQKWINDMVAWRGIVCVMWRTQICWIKKVA